jgi:hypothetical protein
MLSFYSSGMNLFNGFLAQLTGEFLRDLSYTWLWEFWLWCYWLGRRVVIEGSYWRFDDSDEIHLQKNSYLSFKLSLTSKKAACRQTPVKA